MAEKDLSKESTPIAPGLAAAPDGLDAGDAVGGADVDGDVDAAL